ncbi:hypothetical protein PHMEG_00025834 [Phytophthora megakarya]|uniref:Eukaryotic/viral aspartic protease n=1 Tax=Phytophthora megakarya TaxID=4795 RepID=A0A225VDL4_9STRA|nr:hypothetical protein PHMEG_00025834 [Phytophthora megakarya]
MIKWLKNAKLCMGMSAEVWVVSNLCGVAPVVDPQMRYQYFLAGLRNKEWKTALQMTMINAIRRDGTTLLYKNMHFPAEADAGFEGEVTKKTTTEEAYGRLYPVDELSVAPGESYNGPYYDVNILIDGGVAYANEVCVGRDVDNSVTIYVNSSRESVLPSIVTTNLDRSPVENRDMGILTEPLLTTDNNHPDEINDNAAQVLVAEIAEVTVMKVAGATLTYAADAATPSGVKSCAELMDTGAEPVEEPFLNTDIADDDKDVCSGTMGTEPVRMSVDLTESVDKLTPERTNIGKEVTLDGVIEGVPQPQSACGNVPSPVEDLEHDRNIKPFVSHLKNDSPVVERRTDDEPEEYPKEVEERLFTLDEVELKRQLKKNAARLNMMTLEEMSVLLNIPLETLRENCEASPGELSTPEYWLARYKKTIAVAEESKRANRNVRDGQPELCCPVEVGVPTQANRDVLYANIAIDLTHGVEEH